MTTPDTMTLAEYNAPIIKRAYDHGAADGRNAAEWFIQDAFGGRHTGDSKAAAAEVLRQLEDGDPAIWDRANIPNLSGEWADSETPQTLARACAASWDELDDETVGEMCQAYEDGANWGWSSAVEMSARFHSED